MNLVESVADTLGRAVGAYLKAVGKADRPPFIEAWADSQRWIGGEYGKQAAHRRALRNSWVNSAVWMIARECSAANFGIYEQTNVDAEPIAVNNHPLEQVLRRPNPWIGRSFLWQYTFSWLQLDGNSYWYVAPDSTGAVAEIWPLPSDKVDVIPGNAEEFIERYDYHVNGGIYRIPSRYVTHIRLPNPFDIFRGLSPLHAAMLASDSDDAMARWNGTFFGRDNVMPSAIINLGSGDARVPVNPADAERLKQDLRSTYSATARKTAITTVQSLDVKMLGFTPRDMDFISGRQFTKDEIFLIYGVPGGLMDKNATEANATTADRVFKEKTIWPLLNLVAEEITAELIIPFYGDVYRGMFDDIRVSNRELELREDNAARETLTIDERRQRFWSLDPLPDGRGEFTVFEMQNVPQTTDEAISVQAAQDDIRRWRDKSVRAFKSGRSPSVAFSSVAIEPSDYSRIRDALENATTIEEIKQAFDVSAVTSSAFFQSEYDERFGNGIRE